jgi:hypothetical protein
VRSLTEARRRGDQGKSDAACAEESQVETKRSKGEAREKKGMERRGGINPPKPFSADTRREPTTRPNLCASVPP